MAVRIDPHTLARARERGATKKGIKDVVLTGQAIQGKTGRLGRFKVYGFGRVWNGRRYAEALRGARVCQSAG